MDFRYLSNLIVLTGVLFTLSYVLFDQLDLASISNFFYALFIYFPAVTLITHLLLSKVYHQNNDLFVPSIMGAIGFKMLLSMSLFMIYVVKVKVDVKAIAALFISLYLIYTFFEVRILLRMIKKGEK